jgi:hypothetical protein
MRHVSITAGDPSRAYFAYGLRAIGLLLPFLGDVHMSGAGGNACYSISYSYGSMVDHSSCQGAQVGVELVNASEGDIVTNSQFSNVGTGVRIRVVPGQVPGPSNDEAVVSGNTITAQDRGIDLTWKRFVFVQGNDIHSTGGGAFQGVSITNEHQTYLSNNTVVGSGGSGLGILLTTDATARGGPTSATTISMNRFEDLATAVRIGAGTRDTIFAPDATRAKLPVEDEGVGTMMLPPAAGQSPRP